MAACVRLLLFVVLSFWGMKTERSFIDFLLSTHTLCSFFLACSHWACRVSDIQAPHPHCLRGGTCISKKGQNKEV